MGAEATRPIKEWLTFREPRGHRHRIGFGADVHHPHELAVPEFLAAVRLVRDDQIGTLAERPGGVRFAEEGRRPANVPDQLHVSQIRAVDDAYAAAEESSEHPVAPYVGWPMHRADLVALGAVVALGAGLLLRHSPDADQ